MMGFVPSRKESTRMGFEPTRAEHNGLAVHRLNHSATSSGCRGQPSQPPSVPGLLDGTTSVPGLLYSVPAVPGLLYSVPSVPGLLINAASALGPSDDFNPVPVSLATADIAPAPVEVSEVAPLSALANADDNVSHVSPLLDDQDITTTQFLVLPLLLLGFFHQSPRQSNYDSSPDSTGWHCMPRFLTSTPCPVQSSNAWHPIRSGYAWRPWE
ncbi:uncharacterized protein LOC130926820 [Corythoichthys intestinalis]|uniref:uncharacterized protein LOC130926820 n=1 Tax=Corythoichthys intestinalis TaxID=161448 RepID=UPI0025A505F9|nr:uncharacterized protein LOC130926820 [Corythoichthys intestinalis]